MLGHGSTKSSLRNALPWLIVAACIALGYQTMRAPTPRQPDSAIEFSAECAFEHVRAIAVEPHPMGSAANAQVRAYIGETLVELGVDVEMQELVAPDYFGNGGPVAVVNVIGRIPGTANSGAIALVAHYDTVPATAGANDNSTGVATLLETARALLAGPPLDNDVLLVFTDGEEPAPRPGAKAFVASFPAFREIGLVVNLEASGSRGASLLIETNGPDAWLIGELAGTGSKPAAFSFLTETSRLLGDIGTDFDEFRNAGTTGMHFAYLHGSPIYHTSTDNLDATGLGSLQHHGDQALGIARRFGFHDFTQPPPPGSAIFFSIGSFTARYPTSWAVPLMLAAVAGMLGGLVHTSRRDGVVTDLRRVVVAVATILGVAVVDTLVWILVTTVRPTLGLIEGYCYFATIIAASGWGILRLGSGTRLLANSTYTPLLLWLSFAVLTAFVGIGFSYLFVWPALAGAMALWWGADKAIADTLRFAMISLATLVLAVPAIDVFLQLAYPRPGNLDSSMPVVALIPLFLSLLVAGLLRMFWPTTLRRSLVEL